MVIRLLLKKMKPRIIAEINIPRPAMDIWERIIDLRAYDQWTSQYYFKSGSPAIGAVCQVVSKRPDNPFKTFEGKFTILDLVEGVKLQWVGGNRMLYAGNQTVTLTPISEQLTKVTLKEEFEGLIPKMMGQKRIDAFQEYYNNYLKELRDSFLK